jgi:hypothetical protein
MLRDALVNGPLWFRDYGLYGMQWGAKELFGDLQWRMTLNPNEQFVISHIWANNPNTFADFFLDSETAGRVSWRSLDEILRERCPEVRADHVFVLTAEEYELARHQPKLVVDPHSAVIPNPTGSPAFVIGRLTYSREADTLFRAEAEKRQRLLEDSVASSLGTLIVRHQALDAGTIADAFDGDNTTLARTFDANPARLEIELPVPQPVRGLRLHLWTATYHVTLRVVTADGNTVEVERDARSGEPPVPIEIELPEPVGEATRLDLTVSKSGDRHVHFRELEILR